MYGCSYREDEALNITILTKVACPKCMSAKSKMALMDLKYSEEPVTANRLKELGLGPEDIPAFVIDGEGFTYPAAMAVLKELNGG